MKNVISIIEENVTQICIEINSIMENMSECSKEKDSCKIISLRNTISEYKEIVEELELPMDVTQLINRANTI